MLHKTDQRTFLLLLVLLQLSLIESDLTTRFATRAGQNIPIPFQFVSNSNIEKPDHLYVYKNDLKIRSLPNVSSSCHPPAPVQKQIDFCIVNTSSSLITLLFINPAVNDSGTYHLAFYFGNIIESKKINLTVHPGDVTTAQVLTSNNNNNNNNITSSTHTDPSRTISQWIVFSILVTSLVLVVVGLLVWFCRTYRIKSDADPPAPNPNITQQGGCPKSSTVPVVSCVEYGVLDFQNRPVRPERCSREVEAGVEYAAIMFPPQKKK
ncbi:uncharacterized protein LOC103025409 [Astyanax mexicanus]|uniref:uncharacterized protein LOC103025409 n=1 Tax=Astyanax mexicanus TaxID=7994 RepID=UPI0020CAD7AC|nr:uncharacterized protein LOC103025409 [Astyanax mexicanus]